jgi:F-type H+-transporting ATPase subunit gamma
LTERLADIGTRITGIRQLGAVVNAMRGIAAARAQHAAAQLAAVDRYAATIAAAIAQALALLPPNQPRPARSPGQLALVLFCAEQGFAGAFSERVLDAAAPDLEGSELFVAGTRGQAFLAERKIIPEWMGTIPSHSPGIPKLAAEIVTALYARLAAGHVDRLEVVFCEWQPGKGINVVRQNVFPLNPAAFSAPARATTPLLNLAPAALLQELTADYLHAQLCQAALHGFVAENEARMEAMAAAHTHTERQLERLQATERRVRQEEITAEIIELAAGEAASREHTD